MRLALGTMLVSPVVLGACATRFRHQPTGEAEGDVLRGGCIEEPLPSAEGESDHVDAHREPQCEVDLGDIDLRGYTDDQRLSRAKQLYEQGKLAYREGDMRLALQQFEAGYAHAPERHVFNIDIGYAALELECCKRARAAFQRFLDLVPEHSARARALEQLQMIEQTGCASD